MRGSVIGISMAIVIYPEDMTLRDNLHCRDGRVYRG